MITTKIDYSKYYLKIYLWRILSLISGFLSLLIVVPHLSDNQELFGIYSFCIAFTIYLTYADIGFLGAGQKYAAEEFAKGNINEEIGVLGFTGMVLILMIIPFSLLMFYFSFSPNKILNDLTIEGQEIATNIFLILAICTPFQIILQRLVQSILIIRIKDFISLRIDFFFNLIKIASVFFFFSKDQYLIVEYFLFINLITILSSIIILIIIRKIEKYDFVLFLKAIKLSKKYFNLTKKLAFSSLLITLGWIIYFEMDIIAIGKWFGPREVAIYAIGFTFLKFLRSLWNIVFSPYSQRFNHFSGTDSMLEMKNLAFKIIDYTMPLCIVVTVVLVLSSKYLVIFWVGQEYLESIRILQILIIGTGFGFISNPASYYFTAKTKYLILNIIAIALPLVFIISSLILVPQIGIEGFAISKTMSIVVLCIISLFGIAKLVNLYQIIKNWIFQLTIFVIVSVYFFPRLYSVLFNEFHQSTSNLILTVLLSACLMLISLIFIYLSQQRFRKIISNIIFNKKLTI